VEAGVEHAEQDVLAGITDRDWTRFARIAVEMRDIDGRLARRRRMLSDRGFCCETWREPLLREAACAPSSRPDPQPATEQRGPALSPYPPQRIASLTA
jgi:hypothetical protein